MEKATPQLTFESIVENMPASIVVSNKSGGITYVNKSACQLFDYGVDEFLLKNIVDLVPKRIRSEHHLLQASYLEAPFPRTLHAGPGNIKAQTKSGKLINVDIALSHVVLADGNTQIISVMQDIGARVSFEEESRSIFRSLSPLQSHESELHNIGQDMVWRSDLNGNIVFLNYRWQAVLGYTLGEMMGENFSVFFVNYDERIKAEFLRLKKTNEKMQGFKVVLKKKNGAFAHLLLSAIPFLDEAENIIGLQGTASDISSLHEAEIDREKMEIKLRESQKQETLAKLVGGIAHDFNNLLHVVGGSASLLSDCNLTQDNRELVEQITQASVRGSKLISQLLNYGKPNRGDLERINISDRVEMNLNLLNKMCGDRCKVITALSANLSMVIGNPDQFDQIIFNLIINARDALNAVGDIRVETQELFPVERSQTLTRGFRSGAVVLSVSDSGMGMDADTKVKLFDPFYTTKGPDNGTGLGLATVFSITQELGGEISVESELGKGTVFTLTFPIDKTDSLDFSVTRGSEQPLEGSETILVVEDEIAAQNFVCRALTRSGYHVLVASNAKEAFIIADRADHTIDLLLTDVVMQGMDGIELASKLIHNKPDMKVLFMSGYSDEMLVKHGLTRLPAEALDKPFTQQALLGKIRKSLSQDSILSYSAGTG